MTELMAPAEGRSLIGTIRKGIIIYIFLLFAFENAHSIWKKHRDNTSKEILKYTNFKTEKPIKFVREASITIKMTI